MLDNSIHFPYDVFGNQCNEENLRLILFFENHYRKQINNSMQKTSG